MFHFYEPITLKQNYVLIYSIKSNILIKELCTFILSFPSNYSEHTHMHKHTLAERIPNPLIANKLQA